MPDNKTRTRPAAGRSFESPWDADPVDVAEQAQTVTPEDETPREIPAVAPAEADDADVAEQSIAVPADPDEAAGQ